MGVIQAKYSTYILVLQLYITSMQTAVFTKKSYHYHQRFSLQLCTYFRSDRSPSTPMHQKNLAAGPSLQELQRYVSTYC